MFESRNDTAMVCQHCATPIEPARLTRSRQTCHNCGCAIDTHEPISWTDIARISNLAEAGFLTDELVGLGFEARIHQLDDFNALSDRWRSFYLIQVPADSAEDAAAHIQQYRDDDIRSRQSEDYSSPLSSGLMDPHFWRPVALIVLTGVASFVIGQRLSGQNPGRPVASNSLPSAVNQIGRPFVTEPAAGEPRYRLSFDARQRAWSLETDRENDGRYDAHQKFRATGAAW